MFSGRQGTADFVCSRVPRGGVLAYYGASKAIEAYYCNFSLNPEFTPAFANAVLRIVGWDADGEARVMEISQHPFFIGTLFVPQVRSTQKEPHPLVTAFIDAAHQSAMAEQGGQPERR